MAPPFIMGYINCTYNWRRLWESTNLLSEDLKKNDGNKKDHEGQKDLSRSACCRNIFTKSSSSKGSKKRTRARTNPDDFGRGSVQIPEDEHLLNPLHEPLPWEIWRDRSPEVNGPSHSS